MDDTGGQTPHIEDAVQEALLAAAQQWPNDGVPENPRSWLVTVANRRLVDQWRSESARRRREENAEVLDVRWQPSDEDDTLTLLFLCCHPSLSVPSQLALTLRAVGGLTTAEIANAFLAPEATMAQRISRAKQAIKSAGTGFGLPPEAERADCLLVVMQVLYLIFNEGYTTSSGPTLLRADLTTEAIRLERMLYRLLPGEAEVAGLLALILLTDARRVARTDADGSLVPLAEQRHDLWNTAQIEEGVALVTRTLGTGAVGRYQLQAAIAAVHDEAPSAEETDWPQILALYEVLEQVSPGSVVTLNRAVAVAMVDGPRAGLAVLGTLDGDDRMARTHRLECGARAPPRAGRRYRSRSRVLPAGGEDDGKPARAALSRAAGGPSALGPWSSPSIGPDTSDCSTSRAEVGLYPRCEEAPTFERWEPVD